MAARHCSPLPQLLGRTLKVLGSRPATITTSDHTKCNRNRFGRCCIRTVCSPHCIFRPSESQVCLLEFAISLLLGIGTIIPLEHPTKASGGMIQATAYNEPHPVLQAPLTAGNWEEVRHPETTLRREGRGVLISPVAAAAAAVAPSAVFQFQRRQEELES